MTEISERLSNLSPEKRELLLRQLGQKGKSVSRIKPRSKDSQSLPLSFSQQRLWFLDQFESGNPAYNIPVILQLSGTLNVGVLEQALSEIVTRHESLRTTFIDEGGKPVQYISPSDSFRLPITDLQNLPEIEREKAARRIATEETMRLFDLADGPLFRFALLQLNLEQYILVAVMHHIISDGWSEELFIQELQIIYQAFSHGQPSPLPELPIQYADFAQWQRQWLQGEILDSQLSFWEKQLTGAPPILEFPTDRPRPTVQTFNGSEQSINLSKSLSEALEALSRQENATLFMTLLTAFKILLYRYTGQSDIVVGTPIANRDRVEIEGLIGFFVNTLALRTNLSGVQSFRKLLNQVREMTLEAYAHQNLPFEKLVEVLQPERSLSHSPFFQVMFVLQNFSSKETIELPSLALSRVRGECKTAKFDLTLEILKEAAGLKLYFEYNTDLFEAATITRLMDHFKNLLESIVADPDQRISDLSLLSEIEKKQLLVGWNDTEADYPLHLCLHQLFEEQVERTPDAIALRYEEVELTYQEFNNRSNQLAHHLRKLGVGPEVLVGVFMERSIEMVVSLYGILKAGGAYVPLDPEYPPERVGFMLEDSQVPVILTQERLVSKLPNIQTNIISFDSDWTSISKEKVENLKNEVTPENLAYVIFTSGSTGRPKGAMNTHRGICNRLHWMQATYQLTPGDRILQKTPFSFDVSVWEFFWPLLFGAQLVVSRPGGHKDSAYLINLIVEQGITTIHFVPSMLQLFIENKDVRKCFSLKRVICSGEALPYELQQRFFAELKSELHNLYGPTEAAVDVSYWECLQDNKLNIVPIGRPVANTQLYILDESMHPVPIGVAGELHIGGIQVARGYLNRPELTAQKFIPDPFINHPKALLYKTGDSVRFLPDGNIEFLGRLDFQVKVRGFRIELGEIESVLSQHPAVREVIVLAREDVPGDIRLAAYFISMDQSSVNIGKLRNYLKEKLPDYMVPAAYVQLETMPLNPNGKVDRRSLPVPKSEGISEKVYVAPQNDMEKIIADTWQELLQVEKVGIDDNFFDMGGHSLLIMQAHRKLSNSIEKELTITDMFRFPTIRTLSTYMVQDSEVTDQATLKKSVDRAQARREALRRSQQRRR